MTIDIENEKLVTFGQLARQLLTGNNNRPVHVSTLHRWRTKGLANGVKLDALKVGGRWATSWAAFSRFCNKVAAVESSGKPQVRTKDQRPEQTVELEKCGW